LQADDKDFKSELGRIVEMDVWDNTKEEAAELLRIARQRLTKVAQEQQLRRNYLEDLNRKVGMDCLPDISPSPSPSPSPLRLQK
jgi:hypothetical protein